MRIIYLSPHLDDAVFSCGGIIWEQVAKGNKVEIWTIFSGDPPIKGLSPYAANLHNRWGNHVNPYTIRREEDKYACSFLGVVPNHLGFPECIYRNNPATGEPLINNDRDLFESDELIENELLSEIQKILSSLIQTEDVLVVPLAVGNHIDHKLVRAAASGLLDECKFYADFPYASYPGINFVGNQAVNLKPENFVVSTKGVSGWIQAIRFYESQLNSFWRNRRELEENVKAYAQSQYGCVLWEL